MVIKALALIIGGVRWIRVLRVHGARINAIVTTSTMIVVARFVVVRPVGGIRLKVTKFLGNSVHRSLAPVPTWPDKRGRTAISSARLYWLTLRTYVVRGRDPRGGGGGADSPRPWYKPEYLSTSWYLQKYKWIGISIGMNIPEIGKFIRAINWSELSLYKYSSTSLIRPPFIRISLLSGRDLAVIFFFLCVQ